MSRDAKKTQRVKKWLFSTITEAFSPKQNTLNPFTFDPTGMFKIKLSFQGSMTKEKYFPTVLNNSILLSTSKYEFRNITL